MLSTTSQVFKVVTQIFTGSRLSMDEWAKIVQDSVLNRASVNPCLWPEEIKGFNESMSQRPQGVPHETLYLVQRGSDGFIYSHQIKVLEVEAAAAQRVRHVTVTASSVWERHRSGSVQLDQLNPFRMAWFESAGEIFPGYFWYLEDGLFVPVPVNLPQNAGIILRSQLDLSGK
jgi:hypothetical protein